MIRTQIQLTEEQAQLLRAAAMREKVSLAELIRRMIDSYLKHAPQPTLAEKKQRALAVVGKYNSGPNDAGVRHDDYLAEIYAEGGQ